MFVIADIEWVTNSKKQDAPTQLAAVKVDETWQIVDRFDMLIKPKDESFHTWEHMAYAKKTAEDFLSARGIHCVLENFEEWLGEEDVILWWHPDSKKIFEKLVGNVLKYTEGHKAFCLCDYICVMYKSRGISGKNPYKIAQQCGIETLLPMHCASNDVEVLRRVLKGLKFPQELLKNDEARGAVKRESLDEAERYVYDIKARVIHDRNCERVSDDIYLKGYQNLNKAVKKGYAPCKCCRKEYREIIKQKNESRLRCAPFAYAYLPSSDVFHRTDCKVLGYSKNIMGNYSYEGVLKLGKRPCKLCKPEPNYRKAVNSVQLKETAAKKVKLGGLSKQEKKAVLRYKEAVKEREKLLGKENLTEQEKNDIYTLTQPRFAFWAAMGYQTFHLSDCVKLKQLTNLKGFSTYRDARGCNLTPCRICKPTAKHDAMLSIPITNKIRTDESFCCLKDKAEKAGFEYKKAEDFVAIATPAGKWRIYYKKIPIRVEHINLVYGEAVEYHEQPRRFLSFSDAFSYIKRHDEHLLERGVSIMQKIHCVSI